MTSDQAHGALRELQEYAARRWPESQPRLGRDGFFMRIHIADFDFNSGGPEMMLHATVENNNTTHGIHVAFKFTNTRDVMRINDMLSMRHASLFTIFTPPAHEYRPLDPSVGALIRTQRAIWYPCCIDDDTLSIDFPPPNQNIMENIITAMCETARMTRTRILGPAPQNAPQNTPRATRILFPQ